VVRNDLDAGTVGATRAVRLHQALEESPGISRVATFGPDAGSDGVPSLVYDQHLRIPYPAVEVYAVDAADGSLVATAPVSAVRRLSGGPEVLTELLSDQALLARPTVEASAGTDPELRYSPTILTDTPRRREASFAAGADGYSATLTAGDALRLRKPQRDYLLPGAAEAVARTLGGQATASSSASDPGVLGGSDPSAMPYSAVDGDAQTAWRPDPGISAAGSWLRVVYDHDLDLSAPVLTLLPGSKVARVTVFSGGDSATTSVRGATTVVLRTPHDRGRDLRIRVDALLPGVDPRTTVGVAELTVPGAGIERTVDLPASPGPSAPERIALTTSGRRDACVFVGERPLCATGQTRLGEDAAGLDRTLSIPAAADYELAASAVPRAGPALDELIARVTQPAVTATASTVAVPDPSGSAQSGVDGDLGTAWIASPDDADPTLTLTWRGTRTISSFKVVLDRYAAGTRPTEVRVSSDAGTQVVPVAADGTARLDPVRTSALGLHLRARGLVSSYDPSTHQLGHLGLGVSEVLVPGVHGLADPEVLERDRARPVSLECGTTPPVVIDGKSYRTAATPTVNQLRRMASVPLTLCDGTSVSFSEGAHRVRLDSDGLWTPSRVELSSEEPESATTSSSGVEVVSWGAVSRTVRLPARTDASLLMVRENANAGWQARYAGRELERVTVDGWQQGYLVPAGAGGLVRLTFTPDRGMGWGLGLSGAALVLLWVGALLPARRRKPPEVWPVTSAGPALAVLGTAVLAAVGGPWGLAMGALAAVLVWCLRRWGPSGDVLPALLAGGLYAGAGLLLSTAPWGSLHYRADDRSTQLLCLLAIAVVVSSVASSTRSRSAGA